MRPPRAKGARVGLALSGSRRQFQLVTPAHLKPLVSGMYKVRLTVESISEKQKGQFVSPAKTLFLITFRDLINRL